MNPLDVNCPHCGAPQSVACKANGYNCIERSEKALFDAEVARLESGPSPTEDEFERAVDATGLV